MADLVKKYYKLGFYTDDNLSIFIQAGYITADDFKELTGTAYTA
ncbi:XkdX family protein [Paucilactobacillus sp. N302-9]